jgi:hypothetical protein
MRRSPCKHVYAATVVAQRITVTERREADGSTTPTTTTETRAVVKVRYPQPNWSAYNHAQCVEKATTQVLLRSLCDGVVNAPQTGRGPSTDAAE